VLYHPLVRIPPPHRDLGGGNYLAFMPLLHAITIWLSMSGMHPGNVFDLRCLVSGTDVDVAVG
jgi:hypothetical protein